MRRPAGLVKVAKVFMAAPNERHWGYELICSTEIPSGNLYPILKRMLRMGWLAESDGDPVVGWAPQRRYYILTDQGREAMTELLAR